MKLPNIIHVGYSKAMSSWLQSVFKKNKNIYYVKKSNYFIPYFNNYEKGIEYYQKYFRGADKFKLILESDEHLLMPGVLTSVGVNITNVDLVTKTMKRIRETLGDVKVLIVIRNQVDMMISKFVQYVRDGGKLTVDTFLDQIIYKNDNYLKYCDYRYSEVINILWELFDRNSVYIIILEEFKKNRDKVLDEISDFMGTELETQNLKGKMVNVSPSYFCLRVEMALNNLLVKKKRTLHERTKTRIPFILWYCCYKALELVDGFVVKQKYRERLFGQAHEAKILKIFLEDNKKLELLLKKDLSNMGYF
jgi:hypothetical protein